MTPPRKKTAESSTIENICSWPSELHPSYLSLPERVTGRLAARRGGVQTGRTSSVREVFVSAARYNMVPRRPLATGFIDASHWTLTPSVRFQKIPACKLI